MRVLGHASALIGIKENVIDVKRSGYKRLSVGGRSLLVIGRTTTDNGVNSEKALIKRAEFDVNLDLVVLEGNKGKSKSWVTAEPELKRDVKSRLRESVTRSADSLGDVVSTASSGNIGEGSVGKVGKLRGLANHLVVSGLLLTGESKLVPDVHPVTVLTVDALTTDLNLNHRDKLLTGVIKPAGKALVGATRCGTIVLVDFRESKLKVCSVGKVTISGDSALDTATEIGLTVESLFN